jgi:hypothetical protein
VARGSGLTNSSFRNVETEQGLKDATDKRLSDEDYEAEWEKLQRNPAYTQQVEGMNRMQDILSMAAAQPTQLDISPILALADAQTGSNLAAAYRRPESGAERRDKLIGYAQKLQDDRRDAVKTFLDSMRATKNGQTVINFGAKTEAGRKSKAEDPALAEAKNAPRAPDLLMQGSRMRQMFLNQDKQNEKDKEQVVAADNLIMDLNDPNWLTNKRVQTELVRVARLAPVSNLDLQSFGGSQALFESLKRFESKLSKGETYTNKDRAIILAYVQNVKRIAQTRYMAKLKRFSQGVTRLDPRFSPDQVQDLILNGDDVGTPLAPQGKSFDELILEEIRAKKGGAK